MYYGKLIFKIIIVPVLRLLEWYLEQCTCDSDHYDNVHIIQCVVVKTNKDTLQCYMPMNCIIKHTLSYIIGNKLDTVKLLILACYLSWLFQRLKKKRQIKSPPICNILIMYTDSVNTPKLNVTKVVKVQKRQFEQLPN